MAERDLRAAVLEKMSTVIDPATGVDVVRMRLIEDLTVEEDGRVSYTFRPSSVFCPITVPLSNAIQLAVAEEPRARTSTLPTCCCALAWTRSSSCPTCWRVWAPPRW
jgi:metal-sulfur cluster biosynthetic enzyme